MAKIFYSLSGEGRGHATRVRAIVDELRHQHEIVIYAPGDAYDLLAPAYLGSNVRVEPHPGLRFHYTKNHRLDFTKTGLMAAKYAWGFPSLLRRMVAIMKQERPDLIITDFEPSLPRAANRCGIPFVSLNHQHFLVVNDLASLPGWLRRHAFFMSLVVRSYYSGMKKAIVSSFYFPPLKPKYRDLVVQVGVILRPSVLTAPKRRDGHLVAYLRRFAPDNVLAALGGLSQPVKVYGLGKRPDEGNLHFEEINEARFLHDLGTSEALISTAGNQLVGEALYLGKPVFAMPEPNNHEQYINAVFLEQEGTGEWVDIEAVTTERLQIFLSRLDTYRAAITPERYNGTPLALSTLHDILSSLPAGNGTT